jgi:hypothetical protein
VTQGYERRIARLDSVTIDEACARIVELGGVRVEQDDVRECDAVFRVMLDPEGIEFCLVPDA